MYLLSRYLARLEDGVLNSVLYHRYSRAAPQRMLYVDIFKLFGWRTFTFSKLVVCDFYGGMSPDLIFARVHLCLFLHT